MVAMESLPRLGLGMAALGRPGYINLNRDAIFGNEERSIDKMRMKANAVMKKLRQLSASDGTGGSSIPWLDCARSYGLSENFVGDFLRENRIPPEEVYVSSKWGYSYVADWKTSLETPDAPHEIKDHSERNFLKQLKETDEAVGEYINLYQIHSATFESGVLENTAVHEALARTREERGWSIGLSVSSTKQDEIIRKAMTITVPGSDDTPPRRLFDSVQCTYNVMEQKPHDALCEAKEAGMDIIIKEGVANGRALTDPAVVKAASELGCTVDALALACILVQPFAPRVLSGAVTEEQLKMNFAAQEVAQQLTSTEEGKRILSEVMEGCKMSSEKYWSDRSALAWN